MRHSLPPPAPTVESQAEQAKRQQFDQWVLEILPTVMSDLHAQAEKHAAEFGQRTGATVTVSAPEPHSTNPKAPWLSFLTLGLGHTLVHIYATRGGGSRLSLHMLPDDDAWVQKNERVLSHAGCFVVRRDPDYELHYLRGDPDGGPKDVMPMGTLLYRAFELLVNAHVQRSP